MTQVTPKTKTARLGKRTQYALRLTKEMHEQLAHQATESGVTMHAYLISVLSQHLAKKK